MTASAKSSALYTSRDVNFNVQGADKSGGRYVPIKIQHTVVSGETVSGTVLLGVHPANWAFVGLVVGSSTAISASAGVGQSCVIGDGTTANKYMLASDFDAVTGVGLINGASIGYTPTT